MSLCYRDLTSCTRRVSASHFHPSAFIPTPPPPLLCILRNCTPMVLSLSLPPLASDLEKGIAASSESRREALADLLERPSWSLVYYAFRMTCVWVSLRAITPRYTFTVCMRETRRPERCERLRAESVALVKKKKEKSCVWRLLLPLTVAYRVCTAD